MTLNRRHALGLVAATLATGPGASFAQSKYPGGPITIVIPTPAGGNLDAVARLLAKQLGDTYGQPVIVDARPGANTAIAAQYVAHAAPNGLTLLLTFTSTQLNTIITAKPTYRMAELAPVILTETSPIAFAVNAKVPARSMSEFIALVKARPGTYNYASYGAGSVANFMGEALNASKGLDMVHVAYRGNAPALIDLIAGQVQSAFADVSSVAREEQASNRIRVLGVTGMHRFKPFPTIPTFREQGLPELDLPAWHGMFAPAATPAPIVEDLGRELARIIRLPDVSEKILGFGFEPSGVSGKAFTDYIEQTGKTIDGLFKSGRIKLE